MFYVSQVNGLIAEERPSPHLLSFSLFRNKFSGIQDSDTCSHLVIENLIQICIIYIHLTRSKPNETVFLLLRTLSPISTNTIYSIPRNFAYLHVLIKNELKFGFSLMMGLWILSILSGTKPKRLWLDASQVTLEVRFNFPFEPCSQTQTIRHCYTGEPLRLTTSRRRRHRRRRSSHLTHCFVHRSV